MISDEDLKQRDRESRAALRITVILPDGKVKGATMEILLEDLRLRPEVLAEQYLIPALRSLKL